MAGTAPDTDRIAGATRALGAWVHGFRLADYPAAGIEAAKHCLLDWLGCAIAGAREPLVAILREEIEGDSAGGTASLVAGATQVRPMDAARINGAAGHALDFDDVHWAMFGHPTVPVLPAVLALGEARDASGADVLEAFIAGYETECRIGQALGGSHYARGFHATATLGAFGAAAACARLLGLDEDGATQALAIAASRAAGLKSQFGTMMKPLHAGDAAAAGLSSARLASLGFDANPEALETEQGFAATHADQFDSDRLWDAPADGFVRGTLFKYHAACYLTHSTIEAVRRLRAEGLAPEALEHMTIRVPAGHLKVCNIPEPETGLEAKFSLRHTAAMALTGRPTGDAEIYTDAMARDKDLIALRKKMRVEGVEPAAALWSAVEAETREGQNLSHEADTGVPALDLTVQGEALREKFLALTAKRIGLERAEALATLAGGIEEAPQIRTLMEAVRG